MDDTTESTEQMPMVPDADEYEQRVDDGRDETLLMHKDALSERKIIQENNIMNEATLEMTLGLQGGMKEDETMTSAGSAEHRKLRIKCSEIGEIQLGDDMEHMKRKMNNASRRSEEKVERLLQKLQTNTMENLEKVMKQTNETILQSVGRLAITRITRQLNK